MRQFISTPGLLHQTPLLLSSAADKDKSINFSVIPFKSGAPFIFARPFVPDYALTRPDCVSYMEALAHDPPATHPLNHHYHCTGACVPALTLGAMQSLSLWGLETWHLWHLTPSSLCDPHSPPPPSALYCHSLSTLLPLCPSPSHSTLPAYSSSSTSPASLLNFLLSLTSAL